MTDWFILELDRQACEQNNILLNIFQHSIWYLDPKEAG